MILDEHEYKISHIPGKSNSVDAISRLVGNAVPDAEVKSTLREEWLSRNVECLRLDTAAGSPAGASLRMVTVKLVLNPRFDGKNSSKRPFEGRMTTHTAGNIRLRRISLIFLYGPPKPVMNECSLFYIPCFGCVTGSRALGARAR